MRRIAVFIDKMISVGGCALDGFAETGALVPPTEVGVSPLLYEILCDFIWRICSERQTGYSKNMSSPYQAIA
jgi:hypothetical protein